MHQTALGYDTVIPDGGRLELKRGTREVRSVRCAEAREDTSDSGGGIRKRPLFRTTRSKDPGLERFCPVGWDKVFLIPTPLFAVR
ncbi:MAG: hypothetical protein C5S49_06920 [Candidatus Methanogaster sp.]|nr:MAG: hypothetical protein C5S49_06920 [ANME-2 cluster archaeon]